MTNKWGAAAAVVLMLGLTTGCGGGDSKDAAVSSTQAAASTHLTTPIAGQKADWAGAIADVRDAGVQGDEARIRGIIDAACESLKTDPKIATAAKKLTEPPYSLTLQQGQLSAGAAAGKVCYAS